MRLVLKNGYPFPYPAKASEQAMERLSEGAASRSITLLGVVNFEWLHTLTVQFVNQTSVAAAVFQTQWKDFGSSEGTVLEAELSEKDGYDHPAIVAKGWAYCGFMLLPDAPNALSYEALMRTITTSGKRDMRRLAQLVDESAREGSITNLQHVALKGAIIGVLTQ